MLSPFEIDVYTNSFEWVGRIGNPESVVGSVVFNGLSIMTITIDATDPMFTDLIAYGARITIQYRDAPLFSGVITQLEGSLLRNGSVSVTAESDWRILDNTLAWIRPANQLTATTISVKNETHATAEAQSWLLGGAITQGTSGTTIGQTGYYAWASDVVYSETALKRLIKENVLDRLGRPITIATDLLRGGDIKTAGKLPTIRFNRLSDACLEILSFDGLGLKLMQAERGTTIGVDVYEPAVWDMPLTTQSGVIVSGTWAVKHPTITRAIMGSVGDLADRDFRQVLDATGLEATYGDVIERFRDGSSSADVIYPEIFNDDLKVGKYYALDTTIPIADRNKYVASVTDAGEHALLEGLPTAGISALLAETETFHFGGTDGIQLGDEVQVEGLTGLLYTSQVTEAQFNYTSSEFTVTPIIGKREDDPDTQLAKAIAQLAQAQRRLSKDR